jgi:cellulose synthase/poly-beta-1,6-N-acetylglucosamine synthase-like glycosyltransferase
MALYWSVVYIHNREEVKKDPVPTKLPFVSILIPAHNEEDNIAGAIESCLKLNYPKKNFEIIVIDDGSTDSTVEIVKKFGKGVRLIKKKNTGKAHSLNVGMERARGEFICVLDADSRLSRDAFRYMVGYFENSKVGAVIPSVKIKQTKGLIQGIQWMEYYFSLFLRKMMSAIDSLFITHGVGTIYRKDVIKKAGGFDEENLTEDLEIALRVIDVGYKIEASINAVAYTPAAPTFKTLLHQRIRWNVGFLHNIKKFKHMILNRRFGHVGLFVIPITCIWTVVLIAITWIFMNDFLDSAIRFIKNMLITNFDWAYLLKDFFKIDPLFQISTVNIMNFMFLATFVIGIILIWRMGLLEKSMKRTTFYIVPYMFLYSILMSLFWILSLPIWLAKGGGRRWEKRK